MENQAEEMGALLRDARQQMSKTHFITMLILLAEISFHLWPTSRDSNGKVIADKEYAFYPFSPQETDTPSWYAYHIFEHLKSILFCIAIATILGFSRYAWLVAIFSIDLISFLLNYYSTWTHFYGIPIGADTVKLGIFIAVVYMDARTGNNHSNQHTTPYNNARTFVPKLLSKIIKKAH